MLRMADLMAERVGESRVHAIVMHAAAEERALELESVVKDRFDCAELFLSEFTPAMGAHIGPGMVGVACLGGAGVARPFDSAAPFDKLRTGCAQDERV